MNSDSPFAPFARLSDERWLKILQRSVTEPIIDGVRMPGFPDATIQTSTVGSSGAHALQEVFNFYLAVKQYAMQARRPLGRETAARSTFHK